MLPSCHFLYLTVLFKSFNLQALNFLINRLLNLFATNTLRVRLIHFTSLKQQGAIEIKRKVSEVRWSVICIINNVIAYKSVLRE